MSSRAWQRRADRQLARDLRRQARAALAGLVDQIEGDPLTSDDLFEEFPELKGSDAGAAVMRLAEEYARTGGQPHLSRYPAFWRLIYLAGRAAERPPAA